MDLEVVGEVLTEVAMKKKTALMRGMIKKYALLMKIEDVFVDLF